MIAINRSRASRRKNDRPEAATSGVRLLAVDDDRSFLQRLRLILVRAGFEVITAASGQKAIERMQEDPGVDLLLVDLMMPEMDGIETVRQIRSQNHFPGLYAILLTAHDAADIRMRALENGLDEFISKTASDRELIGRVRRAARRVAMERRLHLRNAELETLALTDELTGIPNRRALLRSAEGLRSAGREFSVVLFDLDRFKKINDEFGHLNGDRILRDVALCFQDATRYGDLIARYGGDEFVLLLPDTGVSEARAMARRLIERISTLRWTLRDTPVSISATFGVAGGRTGDLWTLLERCDHRLYRAKVVDAEQRAAL